MPDNTEVPMEKVRKILELRGQKMSFRDIGKQLGLAGETCRRKWNKFSAKSSEPLPEFTGKPGGPPHEVDVVEDARETNGTVSVVTQDKMMTLADLKKAADIGTEWICTHFTPNTWQGFYRLRDGSGHKKVNLYQTKAAFKRIIDTELREALQTWTAANIKPMRVPKRPKPHSLSGDGNPQAVAWGLWDAHLGMYAFSKETGSDYDMDIAMTRCMNSVDDMIDELSFYNIETIWMPIGNDFMHFDNVKQMTANGNNPLDCDSRLGRVYEGAMKVLAYMVQRATEICENVDCFWVPGNHDHLTSFTLTAFLQAYFKNDSRVTVDLGHNPQKIRRFGGTALMFEHGQNVPMNRWQLIFDQHIQEHAHREGIADRITHKEVQIGHTHQKRAREYGAETPLNGLTVRTNPSLCGTDFWHHSKGFIGATKSVEAYRYDKVGIKGSHVCWARDDERKK